VQIKNDEPHQKNVMRRLLTSEKLVHLLYKPENFCLLKGTSLLAAVKTKTNVKNDIFLSKRLCLIVSANKTTVHNEEKPKSQGCQMVYFQTKNPILGKF
jgi:hypothetical protein